MAGLAGRGLPCEECCALGFEPPSAEDSNLPWRSGPRPPPPTRRGTSGASSPRMQGWQAVWVQGREPGAFYHWRKDMAPTGRKPRVFAGIDVSAKELVVALVRNKAEVRRMTFENSPAGHKHLVRALTFKGGTSRVVLEATGNFHLDPALVLSAEPTVELMVVNPLAARRFAQAQMRRAKTDKVSCLSSPSACPGNAGCHPQRRLWSCARSPGTSPT